MSEDESGKSHRKYSFPFEPYPQQLQLMDSITQCIENSQVGCFESPTGTGKSLSIACASLSWLISEENRIVEEVAREAKQATQGAVVDDWLQAILKPVQRPDESISVDRKQKAVDQYQRDLEDISRGDFALRRQGRSFQRKTSTPQGSEEQNELSEFLLMPYDSDTEKARLSDSDSDSSGDASGSDEDCAAVLNLPQILYCSRTHTQLSQFVKEIRNTSFRNARCIILSGRKPMCVNDAVLALKSDTAINEMCLDMQRAKTGRSVKSAVTKRPRAALQRCEFHQQHSEQELALKLLGVEYSQEQSLQWGRKHQACPYYASRRAVRRAQVVCMPYQTLLHKDVREATGISLKNRIVVVDEAHNLVEAINQMHCVDLSSSEVRKVSDAISLYTNRFHLQLHGRNLFYLNLLHSVLKKLQSVMDGKVKDDFRALSESATQSVQQVNSFLFSAGLDHVNFFKLRRYLKAANLVNRIGGFAESLQRRTDGNSETAMTALLEDCDADQRSLKSSFRSVLSFVSSLTRDEIDGRIFLQREHAATSAQEQTQGGTKSSCSLRFVMLHAASAFEEVLRQARSVLLLGGTMTPFSFFTTSLLSSVPADRLRLFSCDHVVHRSRVLARIVGRAAVQSSPIECTHDKRLGLQCTQDIFSIILESCKHIPAGVVVFFTSYSYLATVIARWKSNGSLQRLSEVKRIFVESKSMSVEKLWAGYCSEVHQGTGAGAVLFSVIGGRLSEGINFSDDLARGVLVVGLPYPDTRDAILQEKIKFHQSQLKAQQESQSNSHASEVINLPEVMCMRAVNQAIGRSIRHAEDFASIVLIDNRYSQSRTSSQLPSWIRSSLAESSLDLLCHELDSFFCDKVTK